MRKTAYQKTPKVGKSTWMLSVSIATVMACSSVSAAAQTGDQGESADNSDGNIIIVTATRREEQSVETPVSLSVVNVDEALSNGVTDINGLADFVPNLQAADGGSPGLGNLVIRGLYAGGAPTTGIYVDDVPYGPVIGGAGNSLAFDGSLFDLDRVEVLRGPQGTLFGASSMGGTVRYVTARPSLTDFEGFAQADVSFTRHGETNQRYRGRVSAPVIADKLAVSVAGYYEDAGGYIDHPLRNATDVNDSEFWGVQGQVLIQPTDNVEIRLQALHQEADYDNPAYEAFDPTTGNTILGDRADIAADVSPRKLNTDIYSGALEVDFDFATLTSVTSFQDIHFDNLTDLTAAFGPIADFLAPAGAPHTVSFLSGFDTERFTQEVRLTSQDNDSFEWLVGIYYTRQETDSVQIATPTPNDVLLLDAVLSNEYEEIAVFANATFYITPDWDITGGIRWSSFDDTVTSTLMGSPFLIGPGPFPTGTSNDDTFVSYLINTRYRVSDGLNLYARAANGFRPGGANQVFQVAGMTIGDPSYDSDSVWSFEAGAKGAILGGQATYDVGFFYVDWKDTQLTTTANGIGAITNAPDGVTAWGIEAAVSGEIFENFNLTATLGITNIELDGDAPLLGGLSGEDIAGNPDFTASIIADYVIPVSDTVDVNLGATLRWIGETPISYMGGVGAGGVPIAPANPFFENSDYAHLDLRAGVKFDPVTIQLYVTNVTDSGAYQSIFTTAPTAYQGTILRPRTFGANVRFDF